MIDFIMAGSIRTYLRKYNSQKVLKLFTIIFIIPINHQS